MGSAGVISRRPPSHVPNLPIENRTRDDGRVLGRPAMSLVGEEQEIELVQAGDSFDFVYFGEQLKRIAGRVGVMDYVAVARTNEPRVDYGVQDLGHLIPEAIAI